MSSKKIIFRATGKTDAQLQPKPVPASSMVPQWWKDMTPYVVSADNPDGKKLLVRNKESNASWKKCTPMLDALTSGYIITLWADVQVTQTQEGPYVTWKPNKNVFELHGNETRFIPAPPGYDTVVFKYINCWIPVTPPGYSIMVTSPFGYTDLPFQAIPAVIDSDKSTLQLLFPMWIRSGFEGIVEKGTPLVQITPFKRDNWASEFESYEDKEYMNVVEQKNFRSTIVNHYVKNHWSKKNYK
jgi:hypothetical protein